MSVTFSGLDSRKPHPRWPQAWSPVVLEDEDEHPLNMSNANARAVLDVLALHGDASQDGGIELTGQVALERARGACHVTAAALRFGSPMTGNLARWRPTSADFFQEPDTDRERRAYLLRRVEELAALVERLAQAGATHLTWG